MMPIITNEKVINLSNHFMKKKIYLTFFNFRDIK